MLPPKINGFACRDTYGTTHICQNSPPSEGAVVLVTGEPRGAESPAGWRAVTQTPRGRSPPCRGPGLRARHRAAARETSPFAAFTRVIR